MTPITEVVRGITMPPAQKIIPPQYYNTELSVEQTIARGMPSRTTIATTTKFPCKDEDNVMRSKLALEMIRRAAGLGYKIMMVDANSSPEWLDAVKAVNRNHSPAVVRVIAEDPNYNGRHFMGKSRRQALQMASHSWDRPYIAWVEPEKAPIIAKSRNVWPLAQATTPLFEDLADIIVPRRKDEMRSYPAQQRAEEMHGNMTVMETMQLYFANKGLAPEKVAPYLDLWIGPRVFNRKGLEQFLNYSGEIAVDETDIQGVTKNVVYAHDQWESIFVPVWNAMRAGLVVRGVPVDYIHPSIQTAFESGFGDNVVDLEVRHRGKDPDMKMRLFYTSKRDQQFDAITKCAARLVKSWEQNWLYLP